MTSKSPTPGSLCRMLEGGLMEVDLGGVVMGIGMASHEEGMIDTFTLCEDDFL